MLMEKRELDDNNDSDFMLVHMLATITEVDAMYSHSSQYAN